MKKMLKFYKKLNRKSELFEPIFVISLCLLFTFGLMASIQSVMGETTTSIVMNEAEGYFLEGKYDEAITGYNELQEGEEWPKWRVKIAEVYSVKGEIDKSNNAIKEAILIRNKVIENNKDKYIEEDKKLINDVVFTFFMNKEYEQAISLGEDYLLNNDKYKPLMRTMFAVYMANNEVDKAKLIVEGYEAEKDSAYDTALLAKMEMMIGDQNKGFETLKSAWEIDENEIKVFDVISQMAAYDRDDVLSKLSELLKDNPNELVYQLLTAKVYSMVTETANLAEEILVKYENKASDSLNYNIMLAQVYKNTDRASKADEIIDNIIKNKENSYMGYHIESWQLYEEGKYAEAFENCKKSIVLNKNYPDNYGFLIPEIMMAWGQPQTIEAYLRTALSKEPFNFNIMVKIAEYYGYNAKKYNTAIEYYELALSFRPDDAEIYYNIGSLELMNDKEVEAIESFEKAISLNNQSGKYYRSLGTVSLNTGENEKAIEAYRSAYQLDKSDVLALNNAACYYISIEGDVWRGFENMKAAYDEMPANIDSDSKKIITDNYNKVEKLYNQFINEEGTELITPEFQLFY